MSLKENWIAGAAIDLFWGDPTKEIVLDGEDELWEFENLFIAAHNATGTDRYIYRTGHLFCDNLERYMAHGSLMNLVTER